MLALNLDPSDVERVRELGYEVVSSQRMDGAGVTLHVLRGPPESAKALTGLQRASPKATFALNHIFDPSADLTARASGSARAALGKPCACRVGIVDTGIDPDLRNLQRTRIQQKGFGGGESRPQAHGDAVASLIVDQMAAGGPAAPGSELYVADMFGDGPLSGSAAALIGGLSWLAQTNAPVINLSLTGPPNPAVAKVLQLISDKGIVIVGAAGNDGPAAPPAFPGAYPQVVAVTAVDQSRRPYRYANRGAYVAFSALGVNVLAGAPDGGERPVSGTSFASPVVAVEIARRLARPDVAAAQRAVQALAAQAVDLGAPGRDPIFGFGLVEARP